MRHEKKQLAPGCYGNYQDRKRVPPGCNIQQVQDKYNGPIDWQSRIRVQNSAHYSEAYRQNVVNSQIYGTEVQFKVDKQEGVYRNPVRARRVVDPAPEPYSYGMNESLTTSFSSTGSGSGTGVFRASKAPTLPQPFNLSYEYRPKKQEQMEASFKFVPREMPEFSEPFKPKLNGGNLTRPAGPSFCTETRASQRDLFEERLRMNNKAREAEMEMKRRQDMEREKEEIKRIRKQMEFRAKPVMGYQGASGKALGMASVNTSGLWNLSQGFRK